jgi:hypothetical protein
MADAIEGIEIMSMQTLDIITGLVMVFLVVSLISSALNELLAAALDLRSSTLVEGITQLVGSVADNVLAHPLVESASAPGKDPSYIEPSVFANALIDEVTKGIPDHVKPEVNQVRSEITKLGDTPLRTSLLQLLDSSQGLYENFVSNVAKWFNGHMDRLSGAYKRRAQWITAIFAVVVVSILNVDALKIFNQLSTQPAYAQQIAQRADVFLKSQQGQAPATTDLQQAITRLNTYVGSMPAPIGWHYGDWDNFWAKITGLFISAVAGSLGAPFWFDALNRLVNLRATGPKPSTPAS